MGNTTGGFDPDAAVAAYLRAHAAECRLLDCVPDHGPWLGLVLPGVGLAALALYFATGLSVRTRDLAARVTSRRWLQASLYAIPLALFVGVVLLPARYWLGQVLGVGAQIRVVIHDRAGHLVDGGSRSPVEWLIDRAPALVGTALLAAIVLPIVMALIRRLPRLYWMVPAAAASAWMLVLMAQSPYREATPLPGGPLADDIRAMARSAAQRPERILVGQQEFLRGGPTDAHVLWWQWRPHVIIDERLFNILPVPPENYRPPYRPVTAAEVRAVAGHELGHLRLGQVYVAPAIVLALAGLLCWLASVGARRIVQARRARLCADGVADLAAFPAVALMFGLAFCAFFPLKGATQLIAEHQADAAGLDIARDPDGFAALAMRSARGAPMHRPALEQWLFDDHPSPEQRIRRAMAWKAQNPPARWRATGLSGPVQVRVGRYVGSPPPAR